MSSGGIFLIRDDGRLVEMREREYDSEDVLQQLLATHPNLLAGDQIDPASPRRWLVIARESAVPSEQGGTGRWAVDNLFLDQDAVPTLVEVKRRSDTRLRREVVGQLLEYAANATAYWPADSLRAQYDTGCQRTGRDPSAGVLELLGPEADVEGFWQRAQLNLRAGRLRLVFVADVIPPELRRIVEFLNEQMDPAEVLAIEVKQYAGSDEGDGAMVRTLVPRVFGQTAEAAQRKSTATREVASDVWTSEKFFSRLVATADPVDVSAIRDLYEWLASQRAVELTWGRGGQYGAFHAGIRSGGKIYKFVYVKTDGLLQLNFADLERLPIDAPRLSSALRERLNTIPGVALPEDARYPQFPFRVVRDEAARRQLTDTLRWLVTEIAASVDGPPSGAGAD